MSGIVKEAAGLMEILPENDQIFETVRAMVLQNRHGSAERKERTTHEAVFESRQWRI